MRPIKGNAPGYLGLSPGSVKKRSMTYWSVCPNPNNLWPWVDQFILGSGTNQGSWWYVVTFVSRSAAILTYAWPLHDPLRLSFSLSIYNPSSAGDVIISPSDKTKSDLKCRTFRRNAVRQVHNCTRVVGYNCSAAAFFLPYKLVKHTKTRTLSIPPNTTLTTAWRCQEPGKSIFQCSTTRPHT